MKHDIVFSQQVSSVHGAGVLRMHMLKVDYYFKLCKHFLVKSKVRNW